MAADHFRAAIDLLPPNANEVRGDYLNHHANVLSTYGHMKGDKVALTGAINIYRSALLELTRERVPLKWALTQFNMGNALSIMGDRESGTARLQEAIQAYRTALEERTRERVPLDWAMTQNNPARIIHQRSG